MPLLPPRGSVAKIPRVLVVLLLLSLSLTSVRATATLTEKDFKRMKIRELRSFIEDRGLSCTGCEEKTDFVRVAYQNRDKKPLSEQGKREVPDAPFWDVWRDNALTICLEAVAKRGLDVEGQPQADICKTLAYVTESFFMQHGKRTASKLRKKPGDMLKTSYKSVYYDAGTALLVRLANFCIASPANHETCRSVGSLMNLVDAGEVVDFSKWVTNVGIENTNPMYEVLEKRDDL